MGKINFSDYQKKAGETAIYPDRGRSPIYPALGLAGEVGEVLEKIKKAIRDDEGGFSEERVTSIKKELGDVLWYLAELSTFFGFDLGDVAEENLDKLSSRKERGVLGGSGDYR